jgi:hypothetical protein
MLSLLKEYSNSKCRDIRLAMFKRNQLTLFRMIINYKIITLLFCSVKMMS